jgi:hypothetical protein
MARWWWYSGVCEQGLSEHFYRCIGKGRWSWAQHNGGRRSRDKVAARTRCRRRVVARPSGIDGRVACVSWQGQDTGRGKSPTAGPVGGWSGPVGRRALARHAGARIIGQVAGSHCPLMGQNRGGERRERGEREGVEFKLNFLKISNGNIKTLNTKVVGDLKIYNFYLSQKFT